MLTANPHWSPCALQWGSTKQNKPKSSVQETSLISLSLGNQGPTPAGGAATEGTPTLSPSPDPATPRPFWTKHWDVKHGRESRQAFEAHCPQLACLFSSANISNNKIVTSLAVCSPPFAHGLVKMLGKYSLSAWCLAGGHAKGTLGWDGLVRGDELTLSNSESLALSDRTGHICQIISLA